MFIDEVKISIKAGKGGKGKVAFDTSKGGRGATGGRGGRGGDIYFEGVSNLTALKQFRHAKKFLAKNGEDGRGKTLDGAAGEDLVLKVPIGTVIHNLDTQKDTEVTQVGERMLAARGGRGGRGNFHFRGPTNTSPMEFEYGDEGESWNVYLELRLIADIGFVGLPNAGKSSLLNELTAAHARVADYPFTTLEPNLGVFVGKSRKLILADIPGLIEGASRGKGLGHKFLRHVARTRVLMHCIAADNPDLLSVYKTVREELKNFNPELLDKKEIICITKSDLIENNALLGYADIFGKTGKVVAVSIYDPDQMEELRAFLDSVDLHR